LSFALALSLPGSFAAFLDQKEGEADTDHLARVLRLIRNSLVAGVPPILDLRSFLVDRREENGGEAKWEPARSHLIVVANHLIGRFGVFPGSAAAAP